MSIPARPVRRLGGSRTWRLPTPYKGAVMSTPTPWFADRPVARPGRPRRIVPVRGRVQARHPVAELSRLSAPLSGGFIKFIGVCELLGALGLVLPGLLRIRASASLRPVLPPDAAHHSLLPRNAQAPRCYPSTTQALPHWARRRPAPRHFPLRRRRHAPLRDPAPLHDALRVDRPQPSRYHAPPHAPAPDPQRTPTRTPIARTTVHSRRHLTPADHNRDITLGTSAARLRRRPNGYPLDG
jgi:hypothetical protein